VERNSANFAPLCPRKLFVAHRLARGGGAKLSEFRPGGGAKLFPGGAKFVARTERSRAIGFAIATLIIREYDANGPSKSQLAVKFKLLESWTEATIRKALASSALAEPGAPGVS
jgi:hypothetical protein